MQPRRAGATSTCNAENTVLAAVFLPSRATKLIDQSVRHLGMLGASLASLGINHP